MLSYLNFWYGFFAGECWADFCVGPLCIEVFTGTDAKCPMVQFGSDGSFRGSELSNSLLPDWFDNNVM